MIITATRRLQYAIGHRIPRHESKCRHLHGHNFVFFLHARSASDVSEAGLDDRGRVIDFGILKAKFDPWFSEFWDHGMVLHVLDSEAARAVTTIPGQKLFYLDTPPTAENLARYVLSTLGPELLKDTGVELTKVVVWETENGIATAEL